MLRIVSPAGQGCGGRWAGVVAAPSEAPPRSSAQLTAAGYDLMVETYVPEKGADDADDGDDDVDDEAVGRCETSSLGSREPSGLELSQSLDTSPKHSGSLARTGSSMRRRRTKSKYCPSPTRAVGFPARPLRCWARRCGGDTV